MDDAWRTFPAHAYGRADRLIESFQLNGELGTQIAALILFWASIEYHLEPAIWHLAGIKPAGTRPITDARQVADLIDQLDHLRPTAPTDQQEALGTWCAAARSASIIRNDIAHGVPANYGGALAFMRNPRWHGEQRKRPFSDYWADPLNNKMVVEAFAVLLRFVVAIPSDQLGDLVHDKLAYRALRDSRSILGEFSDQRAYNPTYEKY